jgi:hypothetical protein
VAIQVPLSNLATFIGGGGGCTGAGGSIGIDGPADCWNDCELQEAVTHASRSASALRAARRALAGDGFAVIEVREQWRWMLGRGIDSSSGWITKYRLNCGAAQQNHFFAAGLMSMSLRLTGACGADDRLISGCLSFEQAPCIFHQDSQHFEMAPFLL